MEPSGAHFFGGGGVMVSPAFRWSCQPLPSLELPPASRHPRAAATRIHLSAETSAQGREKICKRGRKKRYLIKKAGGRSSRDWVRGARGCEAECPGRARPQAVPGGCSAQERGAQQPARVHLRGSRKQRELKAAETPAKRVCRLQMKREII